MRPLVAVFALLAVSWPATAADPQSILLNIEAFEDASTNPRTVKVKSVTVNGVADRMGIRPGDIIQAVNNEEITSAKKLVEMLKANTSVSVTWKSGNKRYRNTAAIRVTTPVGEPPKVITSIGQRVEVTK